MGETVSSFFRLAAAVFQSSMLWFTASGSFAVYTVGYYLLGAPPVPLMATDSFAYWSGYVTVPIGYPAFMWMVYDVFGSLKAIVTAQIVLFSVAVMAVQLGIQRVTGSAVSAGITAVLLFVVGCVPSTAIVLLTESVFTSIILFHVAAAGCVLARPTHLNLAMLPLTAVLAIAIRPAGYFLLGGILLFFFFWPRQRMVVLRWALGPLVVLVLCYYGAGEIVRGSADQSIGGFALFPHVAHLYSGPPPGFSPELAEAIDSPSLREYQLARQKTTNWKVLQNLEAKNFNSIMADVGGRLAEKMDPGLVDELRTAVSKDAHWSSRGKKANSPLLERAKYLKIEKMPFWFKYLWIQSGRILWGI